MSDDREFKIPDYDECDRLFPIVMAHPRAVELLYEEARSIFFKVDGKVYFVINTISYQLNYLEVLNPQIYESCEWEDNAAPAFSAIERVMNFFRYIVENSPEEFRPDHVDFSVSASFISKGYFNQEKMKAEFEKFRESNQEKTKPKKRNIPLLGPKKEYLN